MFLAPGITYLIPSSLLGCEFHQGCIYFVHHWKLRVQWSAWVIVSAQEILAALKNFNCLGCFFEDTSFLLVSYQRELLRYSQPFAWTWSLESICWMNGWIKTGKKGQVSVRRNNRKRKVIIHSHLPNSYSGPGALLGNERGYRSTNVSFLKWNLIPLRTKPVAMMSMENSKSVNSVEGLFQGE